MNDTPRFRTWTLAVLTVAVLASGCGKTPFTKNESLPPQVAQLLGETVQSKTLPASLGDEKELLGAWKELQKFYERRGYQPAWSTNAGPRPQAAELIQALPPLALDGLELRRYRPDLLAKLLHEVRQAESFDDPQAQRRLVNLDVELTYTYLTLASHLATGRLQPEKLRVGWYTKPRNVDLDARLVHALTADSSGEILKIFRSLTPPHPDYQNLRKALSGHRIIDAQGGWGTVPPGPALKTGARGPRVAALRHRLTASDDLAAPAENPENPSPAAQSAPPVQAVYDQAVAAAVSHFQRRHGLEATGKVDEETLAELNVPVEERIRQIQSNMERWRWLPASLGDRYILVNIPEFRLDLVEAGKPALAMRVIVGKTQSSTPAFSDKMTYLEVNPSWNIPASIAKAEILPKLAADPGYLASHDMEMVSESGSGYRLRQRPGPSNPLGQIKFMFPNEFDIYLHDTPADHLFGQAERDFSHGCIRLERPFELAAYLLKEDPKWTPEAIRAAIDTGENQSIQLPRPIAVHLLYWTAWVDPDGTVEFRKDLYGHDVRLQKALAEEPQVWLDLPAVQGEMRAGL